VHEAIILLALISLITASFIFQGSAPKKQVNLIRIFKAVFISNCFSIITASLLYYNSIAFPAALRLSSIKQLVLVTGLCFILLLGTMLYQFIKKAPTESMAKFLLFYFPLIMHSIAVTFFVQWNMIAISHSG
jgi:hypothetical protein